MTVTIRAALPEDASACAAIYGPYVTDTAITFEVEPPTASEMAQRMAAAAGTHAWLVLVDDGQVGGGGVGGEGTAGEVVGYAYAHAFASRAAYRWACETSIYLEMGRRRTGGGRALYEELFSRLAARGFRRVVAGMTLPNDASQGLHRSLGFEPVGTYRQIGWKNNAWHDVAWVQKTIVSGQDPPADPA